MIFSVTPAFWQVGNATAGVELDVDKIEKGQEHPRAIESRRPALKDTHLEAIDVHLTGEGGSYEGTIMSIGGSGRIRIAHLVTLLKPGAQAKVNGFSLSGGAQRTDCKTNIHHIADGTTSQQLQKNMVVSKSYPLFQFNVAHSRVLQTSRLIPSAVTPRYIQSRATLIHKGFFDNFSSSTRFFLKS